MTSSIGLSYERGNVVNEMNGNVRVSKLNLYYDQIVIIRVDLLEFSTLTCGGILN